MPIYQYRARREDGTQTEGTVEAVSRAAALSGLRQQRLWVTELQEAGVAPGSAAARGQQPDWARSAWHAFRPVSSYALMSFFAQLGQLVGSGIGMHETLVSLRGRVGNRRLRRVLSEIAPAISAGGNLGDQLGRYPQFFPPHVVGIVRAGEQSGKLDEVAAEIARGYELETIMWAGMAFHKLLYGGLILLCLLVLPFPEMLRHGDELREMLNWYIHVPLVRVGEAVLVFMVAYHTVRTVLNLGAVRTTKEVVAYFLPLSSMFVRNAACSRFVWSLKILIGAGIQFPQALDTAATATGNAVIERQIRRAAERVRLGIPANEALVACTALPVDMRGQLATAEQTGRFDETLNSLSELATRRRKTSMWHLKLGSYVFLIVTGVAIVGFVVVVGWKHFYEIMIQKFSFEE